MARTAEIERKTHETDITLRINIDGTGQSQCDSGSAFFDHMLDQLARHSLIDMNIHCQGDNQIDDHHSVEDIGIALGTALCEALGEKRGIRRYGECILPMDEARIEAALDFSGRGFLVFDVDFPAQKIGNFDTELVREFFQALAMNAGLTLHITKRAGYNAHHIAEASFKAVARAMRMAVEIDDRMADAIPSTKGQL